MTLTTSRFTFHFPPDFDERAEFEMPSKGYLEGGHVELEGRRYPVTIYDPVRLSQELSLAAENGNPVIAAAGLIVIPDVTREAIQHAIEELVRQGYFRHQAEEERPVDSGSPTSQECPGPEYCISCRRSSVPSTFCPLCGKAKRKWCKSCGEWKLAYFEAHEIDDDGGAGIPIVLASYPEEILCCPDCGSLLQSKAAARE
jgi:hypothetical protein